MAKAHDDDLLATGGREQVRAVSELFLPVIAHVLTGRARMRVRAWQAEMGCGSCADRVEIFQP